MSTAAHVSDPGTRWTVPDPRELALRIRLRAVRMVAALGMGYLGQALSSAERRAWLRKDFDLGLDAARSLEVPMPVAATVYQLIQSAIGIGLRDEDFLSLYDQQALGAGLALEPEG